MSPPPQGIAEELFNAHYQEVSRFVTRKVNCVQAKDDIMQELYLRLAGYPELDNINNTRAFLLQIASNLIRDNFRRASYRLETSAHEVIDETVCELNSPARQVEQRNMLESMTLALNALPEEKRDIIWLNRVEGWSYGKIAKHKKRSVSWVEKSMAQALLLCHRATRTKES